MLSYSLHLMNLMRDCLLAHPVIAAFFTATCLLLYLLLIWVLSAHLLKKRKQKRLWSTQTKSRQLYRWGRETIQSLSGLSADYIECAQRWETDKLVENPILCSIRFSFVLDVFRRLSREIVYAAELQVKIEKQISELVRIQNSLTNSEKTARWKSAPYVTLMTGSPKRTVEEKLGEAMRSLQSVEDALCEAILRNGNHQPPSADCIS